MPRVDLTLRCPTCGRRADVCFDHGDAWKKRRGTELQPVRRAATKAASALRDRDAAIRQAHAEGATLRAIAEAAGLSFARIYQICKPRETA